MHLLDAAMTTNRKKIKIEQLLLLLLRSCIPLFLAFCMARPVITGMKNLIRNAQSSMIIMLDNSYSMESGDSEQNPWKKATDESSKIIKSLPRGSQVALLGMAGPLTQNDVSGYDLAQSRRLINNAQAGYGSASPETTMESAATVFAEEMHHADQQLVIVSDFQKSSWANKNSDSRQRAFELINSNKVKPRLILMNVGNKQQENVAVQSIELSQTVIGVGQQVKIRAHLKNFGQSEYTDLRVYFKADGENKAISQVNLASLESSQVLFSHRFEKAGSHIIEISIEADSMKADNTFSMSVPVLDELPVLIIDGDPHDKPLKSESAFLNLALQPFASTQSTLKDMTVPTVHTIESFKAEHAIESRVIILANVNKLSDSQLQGITDFVDNGGGLMIFPGDKIDLEWYNKNLLKNGQGLLPLQLGKIKSFNKDHEALAIVSQHYDHPALDLFNDSRNGTLNGALINSCFELLNIEGGSAENSSVTTLMKLTNGQALLVEKQYGHGKVVLASIPADADWSNLPMRPFYLPLIQQLVAQLASTVYPPRNLEVGQNIAAILPLSEVGSLISLTNPAGENFKIPLIQRGSHAVLEYKQTELPGIYLLKTSTNEIIHYVVSTDRSESKLDSMSEEGLQNLAKEMDASLVQDYEEYRQTDQSRRYGQEIWIGLLWVVLIAAFGELFLIQYFTEKRA